MDSASRLAGPSRWLPWMAAGVGGLLALRQISGFDTWWHLATGRWIAANADWPAVDVFSHTAVGREWVNLQWLFDLGVYALYRSGGAGLLIATVAVLVSLACLLVVHNSGRAVHPAHVAIGLLWTLLMCHERFTVRPEIASYLWLGLLIALLLRARSSDGRGLWAMPLVMLAWTNTHALFVVGLFVILCALSSALVARVSRLPAGWREASRWSDAGSRRLMAWAAVSFAAPLLNPYGFRGAIFPVELWSRINGSSEVFSAIGEFRAPFESLFPDAAVASYQVFLVLASALMVLAALRASAKRPFDLFGASVFLGLSVLSLLAWRNVGLLAFGGTPFVLQTLGREVGERQRSGTRLAPSLMAGILLSVAVFAVPTGQFYRFTRQGEQFGFGVLQSNTPERAVAFAREAKLPGLLFNDMALGGYLTWEPAVEGGVFIDGRLEVYDAELFAEYQAALADPAAFQDTTNRHGVSTVMLFHRWKSRHPLIRRLVESPLWALVYFDEVAVTFVRIEGNAAVIRSALERFPEWASRTESRLAADPPQGRFPADLVLGVGAYATLLDTIGYGQQAVSWYERSIALGLPRTGEVAVRVALADHYIRRGEPESAVLHLRRAAELDPKDTRIRDRLVDLQVR